MHQFVCANNGIDRARTYAKGAANAARFVDDGQVQGLGDAVFRIQRLGRHAEQIRQLANAHLATRRALVDLGAALGNGSRIGHAPVEAALGALGLWQQGVDFLNRNKHQSAIALAEHAQHLALRQKTIGLTDNQAGKIFQLRFAEGGSIKCNIDGFKAFKIFQFE